MAGGGSRRICQKVELCGQGKLYIPNVSVGPRICLRKDMALLQMKRVVAGRPIVATIRAIMMSTGGGREKEGEGKQSQESLRLNVVRFIEESQGIDGQEDMKHIYGIRIVGLKHKTRKGDKVSAYDDEDAAAHAYDLAALKFWGPDTILNFPLLTYEKELMEMEGQSREEYIGSIRRKSSGFSRGASKYRGVARHHHNGKWEARIGRVFGNKYLYLGTYATQEEAAVAYDMAAIEYRGLNAVTNFDLSHYIKWIRPNNTTNKPNPNPDPATTNLAPITTHNSGGSSPIHHFQPPTDVAHATSSQSRPTTATSALGLLLQSTKFKEMMEMALEAESPKPPMETECELSQSSIPEDINTYFDTRDFCTYNDQGYDIFGQLNSFMQPMVQFDSMLNGEDLMI
ncbi:AP2-like ethylene-responsive transcription factor At1g16060 [Olea europaea subsp. europaea]|uniref:AP2-like ethylene-responsive transcription factor At1g16060 n=1 Tax=Olea europaea subsp. europaea TaxID=158383 RepID=A0A8S0QH42_OLEEU|nr:AP2-like ethylene-responsive transcription factor At1g16060 [Olea europaea subsp. europaea]